MLDILDINAKLNLDIFLKFSKISIISRINQDQYYFSQIFEMRITLSGSFTDVTYD